MSFTISVTVSALVDTAALFFNDFEGGDLNEWPVLGEFTTWGTGEFDEDATLQGHNSISKVAETDFCDMVCIMTIVFGLDLTGAPCRAETSRCSSTATSILAWVLENTVR